MGTPCSTGAAGALRMAMFVQEIAWALASMQKDMEHIFEGGRVARSAVAQLQAAPEGVNK